MTCVSLVVLLSRACTRILINVHTVGHLVIKQMDDLDDNLQQFQSDQYSSPFMLCLRLLQRCTISKRDLLRYQTISGHMTAIWGAMMILHARMTSYEHGPLVDLLKATLHYSLVSTVRSYIATKHRTARCSYGSSIIFVLVYATPNHLLSLVALFLVPTNPEKLILFCFPHYIILLHYSMKALRFLMRLRLRKYRDPFQSSQ